jgi:transcriptional regulator with XRE-family HTH domain
MEATVGSFLRELRKARGWSMAQAAARAGIGRVTLNRWETDRFQPRLPELEAVLSALRATATQRLRALMLLRAPRALQHLYATGDAGGEAFPERMGSGGSLLRAMRLRRGWNMETLAHRIGVEHSTISRWERGESWPSAERLHAVCFALEAHEAELTALTCGRFSLVRAEEATLEETEAQFRTLQWNLASGIEDPLTDLQVFALQAQASTLAARRTPSRDAERLSGELLANYAQYLFLYERYGEAIMAANRALEIEPPGAKPQPYQLRAVINAVRATVKAERPRALQRGIALLNAWLPDLSERSPIAEDFGAWMLEMLADLHSRAGYTEEALRYMAQSNQLHRAYRDGIEGIEQLRCTAVQYIRAGRSQEAFPPLERALTRLWQHVPLRHERPKLELQYVRALLAEGNASQAHDWLLRVYTGIDAYALAWLRPEADALAERL